MPPQSDATEVQSSSCEESATMATIQPPTHPHIYIYIRIHIYIQITKIFPIHNDATEQSSSC